MKYSEPESSILEFKQTLPTNVQLSKSIIGFCNQHGGKLILGVKDDRTIVGIPEEALDEIMLKTAHIIHNACHPPILPLIYSQRIQDKLIIIIEVSAGLYKPYFLKSKGLTQGTYVRLGPSTVLANAEMIQAMQWQAQGYAVDQAAVYNATIDDLDEKAVDELINAKAPNKTNKIALLKGHNLLVEEHQHAYPTVAGILLFAKVPQQFISEAFIICTHFAGTRGREALATRDCEGTLFQQFIDAHAWVLSRLNRSFTIKGPRREEQLEIPEDALREVLINAIVHRSYQHKAPTKIAIYDDRIEIFSPGNFPGPLTTDQLEYGFTYMRNPTICKFFRRKGLMEKLGSGFVTLFEQYRDSHLPTPEVIEGSGFVKCILPRPGPDAHLQEVGTLQREAEILRLLSQHVEVSITDIEKTLSISKPTAIRTLNKLIAEGQIIRVGRGPTTRYQRVHQ